MSEITEDVLGSVPPRDLVGARLVLHHAALIAAAVGKDLHPPQPDASHKALCYEPALRALAGPPATDGRPIRAALRVPDLTLLLLGVADDEIACFALRGRTLDEAEVWLNESLRTALVDAPSVARQVYESFPEHPVGNGALVPDLEPASLEEIERLLAVSWRVLQRIRAAHPEAGPPRLWPHHLDAAILIPVGDGVGENARSIGVGFSLGDDATAEPYWYVSPWPYLPPERVPQGAPLGTWHAEPFFGSIFTATELLRHGGDPAATIHAFFTQAVSTARVLVES